MIDIRAAQPEDANEVFTLLSDAGLPLDGLREHLGTTLVARQGGGVVGVAAVEIYDDGGLLRSVAVDPKLRGSGLGRQLVERVLEMARARRLPALYLLTTTAAGYFPRLGFSAIGRDDVPPGVQQSIEFRSACPAGATVMMRRLS